MQATSHSHPIVAQTGASPFAHLALGRWKIWRLINAGALGAGDLLAIGAVSAGVAALAGLPLEFLWTSGWWPLCGLCWLLGGLFAQLLPDWGLGTPAAIERLCKLMAMVLGVVAAVALLIPDNAIARHQVMFAALPLALPVIFTARALVKGALLRLGVWGVPVAVYGGATTGRMILQALREHPGYGYRPVAVFDDDVALRGTQIEGVPVVGSSRDALEVPVAILAMPGLQRRRLVELLGGPLAPYPSVILIPDLFEVESMWARTREFHGVMGLEIARNLMSSAAQRFKRTMDVVAVLLSAPLWLPACALIALLIWLEDRQHPLFLQARVGHQGQVFRAWKFRTMVPNAEAVLQRRLAEDPALRAEWEANYKLRQDPRITRIGRILRRTSLDELPQLVNVLFGEMSLVGPRPLPAYHHEQLSAQTQRLRLQVKPGMTGMWQVSGRSEAGNAGMERWDPYYVRNWSLWLDLYILARTVRVVLRGSGAY